ncbi:hypothetical protein PVAND_000979 [Polypedilum vanderplanki]|uniref:Uncharacterized protein n=1 Tax=Polypedilum vanderplanki TaxID=319348 RepID=A0A9J6BLI9_POLVA|nr:hypothetical protein PVAND_000979 [Polypedilum vanderplanki]
MLVLYTILLFIFAIQSAFCGSLNDEYSVGTNLNKYLYSSKMDADDNGKTDNENRPRWYAPRMGKRSYLEDIPPEIMEIFEKIENSPELQKLLLEKYQFEEVPIDVSFLTKTIKQRSLPSRPFTPRYGRDSSETQNLNSRPYPPRFGKRTNSDLPPYLPRLGRSAN